ncbi:MAG: hypothetical protein FWB76_00860 [Oscillospiraceae bacterium]|nr:hypothetical protein [Oscillospiraceae bacterium]
MRGYSRLPCGRNFLAAAFFTGLALALLLPWLAVVLLCMAVATAVVCVFRMNRY